MESMQGQSKILTAGHSALRWIAVVPGGMLAALAVTFPIHWLVVLQYTRPYRTQVHAFVGQDTLESLVGGFFVPFVFIVAGAKIAPRHHFRTAVVLSALLVPVFIYALFFAADQIRQGLYETTGQFITLAINILLWVAGYYAALRVAKKM